MKTFAATVLATALTVAFSSAYAHPDEAKKPDNAAYKNMNQKAAADYKLAVAKCDGLATKQRAVCIEEAKVVRARTDVDSVVQYNNTVQARLAARNILANAQHALARAKCAVLTIDDQATCLSNAQSTHTAALGDAKADRDIRVMATVASGVDGKGLIANTATKQPVKAAAVDRCAQIGGGSGDTGCLVNNKARAVAAKNDKRAEYVAENTAENTREAATTLGQKTENLAEAAVRKTKNAAAYVANKTENVIERIADRTDNATDRAAVKADVATDRVAVNADRVEDRVEARAERAEERMENKTERTADRIEAKTERTAERIENRTELAAAKTSKVISDAVITTKVKADLFKEPELSAMAIHVETEKGVVMLSGFVDTKASAERAVRLAKSVEGVNKVKSAIMVK